MNKPQKYSKFDSCPDGEIAIYIDWYQADEMDAYIAERLPKWVSVDERLPDENTDVLWLYKDGDMTVHFMAEDGADEFKKSFTHWQPLPPAPKEGE